jgi:hypothetical protein
MSSHTLKTYLFQEYETTALRTSYRKRIPPPALISIVSSVLLKPRNLALSQSAIAKHLVPKFQECNIFTNLSAEAVLELQDVTLNSLTVKATNEVFPLYGFTIQAIETIQGGLIKADTILGYLQAASAYVRLVGH